MQQLQSSVQEERSIFKPMSGMENNTKNVFNFEPLFSYNGQNSRPKIFPTISQSSKQKESDAKQAFQQSMHQTEQSFETGERLTTLHHKLCTEADKIRKWKLQTEMELKQKEKKIQDVNQNVDALRKSLLELQLQNENLSIKLQEEMENREEILQKVNATRDICNLLKEHTGRLEEKIIQCETERTELKYLEREHFTQFEELSQKFTNLEIAAVENQNKLTNKLNSERSENELLEKECQKQIKEAESQLKIFMECCDEKEKEVKHINAQILSSKNRETELESTINNLQTEMQNLKKELQSKQLLIKEQEETVNQVKLSNAQLAARYSEVSKDLNEAKNNQVSFHEEVTSQKSQLLQEIDSLKNKLEKLSNDQEDQKLRYQDLLHDYQISESLTEELKSSKEILKEEKADLEQQLNILDQQKQSEIRLNEQIINLKNDYSSVMEVKKDLEKKFDDQKQDLLQLQKKYETISEEKKIFEEDALNKSLEIEIERKRNGIFLMERSENEMIIKDFESKTHEMENLKMELKNITLQNQILIAENERKNNLIEEFQSKLKHLEEQLQMHSKRNDELLEEKETNDKVFQNEVQQHSKTVTDLQAKNKTFKSEIASKARKIKSLEKEVKNIKLKLTSEAKLNKSIQEANSELNAQIPDAMKKVDEYEEHVKTLTDKVVLLERELATVRETNKELLTKNKLLEESSKQQEEECSSLNAQFLKVKETAEIATIQKNKVLEECESQRCEMMATLEKYQQENQKILAQKDKELDSVHAQMEQTAIKQNEKFIEEHNKEIEKLKWALANTENEKMLLFEKVAENEKKLNEMNQVLKEKDKSLQNIIEKKCKLKDSQKEPSLDSCILLNQTHKSVFTNSRKTPQIAALVTPQQTSQSLQVYPQKSNLIQDSSKKRKVTVLPEKKMFSDSDSSSDLMEFQYELGEKNQKEEPIPYSWHSLSNSKITQSVHRKDLDVNLDRNLPLKPIPRGPSLTPKSTKENMRNAATNKAAASSSSSRIFKTSLKERKKSCKAQKKDISWLDLDSIFGFGTED